MWTSLAPAGFSQVLVPGVLNACTSTVAARAGSVTKMFFGPAPQSTALLLLLLARIVVRASVPPVVQVPTPTSQSVPFSQQYGIVSLLAATVENARKPATDPASV